MKLVELGNKWIEVLLSLNLWAFELPTDEIFSFALVSRILDVFYKNSSSHSQIKMVAPTEICESV